MTKQNETLRRMIRFDAARRLDAEYQYLRTQVRIAAGLAAQDALWRALHLPDLKEERS